MSDLRKCCFCGKVVRFMESHDPSPVDTRKGKRCCLECNYRIVLPARSIINNLIENWKAGKQAKVIKVPDYSSLLEFTKQMESKAETFYSDAKTESPKKEWEE